MDAEKSAVGAKETESTPLQLTEEATEVIDSKNIIGPAEERKAHEPRGGSSSEKIIQSESQVSKQSEIFIEGPLDDEKDD